MKKKNRERERMREREMKITKQIDIPKMLITLSPSVGRWSPDPVKKEKRG
jgi:hypothetical protein